MTSISIPKGITTPGSGNFSSLSVTNTILAGGLTVKSPIEWSLTNRLSPNAYDNSEPTALSSDNDFILFSTYDYSLQVYRDISSKWENTAILTPSDYVVDDDDNVGITSSSIIANKNFQILMFGIPFDTSDRGAAWVFSNTNNSTWNQITKIIPDDNIGDSHFGQAVDMVVVNGVYTAIIGGNNDDGFIGAVWIYKSVNGTVWNKITKIVPDDCIGNSQVGQSVKIIYESGKYTVAFGGQGDDNDKGAVWIYQLGNLGWEKVVKLIPSSGQNVGVSLDMTANSGIYDLIVGSFSNVPGPKVFLYRSLNSTTWTLKQTLTSATNPYYGFTVGISGDIACTSGLTELTDTGVAVAYMYKYNPDPDSEEWEETNRISVPFPRSIAGIFSMNLPSPTRVLLLEYSNFAGVWIYDYVSNTLQISGDDIDVPGTITSTVFDDGYGTEITSGIVNTKIVSTDLLEVRTAMKVPNIGIEFGFVNIEGFGPITLNGVRQGTIAVDNITLATGGIGVINVSNEDLGLFGTIFCCVTGCGSVANNFSANTLIISEGVFAITVCNVGPSVSGANIRISFIIFDY